MGLSSPVPGGIGVRLRAILIALGFVAAFAIVADLAWATAVTTTAPWFSPGISLQSYSIAFVAGSILAPLLAGIASIRLARMEEELQGVDLRIAWHRAANRMARGESADDAALGSSAMGDLGRTLAMPSLFTTGYLGVVDQVTHEALMTTASPLVTTTGVAEEGALRALRAHRQSLAAASSGVWPATLGPILASVVMVVLAGSMLPGVEGFGVSNFQLNTTLILFLGYSWPFLVAWVVAAIALVHRMPGAEGAGRESRADEIP